jgi:hypothetical protein
MLYLWCQEYHKQWIAEAVTSHLKVLSVNILRKSEKVLRKLKDNKNRFRYEGKETYFRNVNEMCYFVSTHLVQVDNPFSEQHDFQAPPPFPTVLRHN